MSSGWIVEPLRVDGQDWSLVWYITKVVTAASLAALNCYNLILDSFFLDFLFLKSIAHAILVSS